MSIRHDPTSAPIPSGGYTQGLEVVGPGRLLHVSGQIPMDSQGSVPATFEGQCEQVWANLFAVLESASMTASDLVKVTTYLAGREYRELNSTVRQRVLGDSTPALTVVIAGIYDEAWLLEIDAFAFQAH